MRRALPRHRFATGVRRALAGLAALLLLVTALGASAHVHAGPGVGSGTVAVASEASDDGARGTRQDDGGDLAGHGLRCGCVGHGGARTDQTVSVDPPAPLRGVHGPVPRASALTSRRDAPPLQPPRA